MLQRLKQILKLKQTEDPQKLEVVLEELSSGIDAIKGQIQKISTQEAEIVEKLENYTIQHADKIVVAKEAFSSKSKIVAEGLYKESKILKQQILQYQRIAEEIQKTKQKLLSQENQFSYTRDQLLSKQALGKANLDASQIRAEISEHLMFLSESKELERFDELIEDADIKSQAIGEIQGEEQTFDLLLSESTSADDSLEVVIAKEKEDRLMLAQRNLKISLNRVFGEVETSTNTSQKENQQVLLNRLKEEKDEGEIDKFFASPDGESQTKSNVKEHKDRINNFFERAKPGKWHTRRWQ